MAQYAKITEGGRLLIPVEMRRSLGLKPGSDVVLDLADGELRVRTVQQMVARVQALVRQYDPGAKNVVDEFIRERREEAARE